MHVLLLAFIFYCNSLAVFAQSGGAIEPHVIDVDVPYSGGERGPRGEPGLGGSRSDGSRGGRSGPPRVSKGKGSSISSKTLQAMTDAYFCYATMLGYTYSQSGNNRTIETNIPIEVFQNEVKKEGGPGLGYLGQQAVGSAALALRAENTSGSIEYAGKLQKVIDKDRQNLSHQKQQAVQEEAQFFHGDDSQRGTVQAEAQIDTTFDAIFKQGKNSRFANLTELDSTYVYTKSHVAMAKRLLNSKTRIHQKLGKEKSYEIAADLIQVALNTTQFAQGFRNGAEGAIVDTIDGVVAISRFTFNGVRNPKQAFNQIMELWEGLNAAAFVDTVSYMIDSSYDVLMAGTPYIQGDFFGLLSTNLLMGFLPTHMVPIISRLGPQLSSNNLMNTIAQMHRLTGHLGRGAVGRIFNLYGKVAGSKGAVTLVAQARSLGLKTQSQLEAMGLFLNRVLKNQLGTIGDLTSLIEDYAVYFKNWNSGFIIDDVLSADNLNASLVAQGRQLSYQTGTVVLRVTSKVEIKGLVRVHTSSSKVGRWITFADEIRGMSPTQIKDYLNLRELPTHVSNYNAKAGEQFTISRIGKNAYGKVEGGTQLRLLRDGLIEQDFMNTRLIGLFYDGR